MAPLELDLCPITGSTVKWVMVLGREWSLKLLQFAEKQRPSPAADSFTSHPYLSLACWYSDRLMCAVPPSPLASPRARPVSCLQGEEDFISGI